MPKSFTDQQIVDGLRQKDPRLTDTIVEFLFHQSQKSITRMVTRNKGDETDAEDLMQETVVAFLQNVWHDKYQLRSDAKVTTYLYGIAHTMWIKELERRSARDVRTSRFGEEQQKLADPPNPEQEVMNAEEVTSAWAVFGRLGEECQKILRAFYFDEWTMKQIADEFGLGNELNAKTKKYRCILALRKLMTSNETTH